MQVDMEPHEPKGNHPLFGMMNLRGCAWYWLATLPVHLSFRHWTIHLAKGLIHNYLHMLIATR
jgi:hypothetical protein